MKKKIFIAVSLILLLLISVGCQKSEEIMRVEDWKDKHPEVYQSYLANAEMKTTTYGGSEPTDYLEQYPELKVFYDGYGFSKEYARARGHVYALEDVINTSRPKAGASCLACKTADFSAALENGGIGVNKMDFKVFVEENPQMETISCYDCHRNTPGEVKITRAHFNDALTFVDQENNLNNYACAQCHVEYYQDPETKAVILPWKNGLNTDDMIEYFDDIEFADWEHPTTGAKMLKAQHPEFETYNGSIHYASKLSCLDCHMPKIEGEENLRTHHWTSPLKSEKGLTQTCIPCHGGDAKDIVAKVEGVQEEVYNKTQEVSDKLLDYINRLTKAVEDGAIEGADLEELREIHRKAQFKWDFVFVENGEGFHNSSKAHKNLNESMKLLEKGFEILEKYGK
jgi:nitrite reductase (cytochrome c-552)